VRIWAYPAVIMLFKLLENKIWVNPMFCPAACEVNYPSIIISIDKDIVRLRITPYYPNILKFLDDVFNLTCQFLPSRKYDGVDVN